MALLELAFRYILQKKYRFGEGFSCKPQCQVRQSDMSVLHLPKTSSIEEKPKKHGCTMILEYLVG